MGTGAIEGIAASEAANKAAAAGAFAPLLALGIPGSGTGAVLLGGLMMWGLNPGPLLFDTNPEFCWGLISSMYMANIFTLAVAILVIPFLIKILSVPVKYMIPIITCVCIVGAYERPPYRRHRRPPQRSFSSAEQGAGHRTVLW